MMTERNGLNMNCYAMLECIAACEGTNTPVGYRALFGYHPIRNPTQLFDNGFRTHPNVRVPFRDTFSTAAGRYQIVYPTFLLVQRKLGTTTFDPGVQDQMALELIAERGAMGDVKNGAITIALEKCSPEWASLPYARNEGQTARPLQWALEAYLAAGGDLTS